MRFQPLSKEELDKQKGLLNPGDADFEIMSAEETKSKAGNPMLKLQFRVWDSNSKEGVVFDYLTPNAQWKIRNFLESIDKLRLYGQGEVNPMDLEYSSGKCVLYIHKDKSGQYGDTIKVKDYFFSKDREVSLSDKLGEIPF